MERMQVVLRERLGDKAARELEDYVEALGSHWRDQVMETAADRFDSRLTGVGERFDSRLTVVSERFDTRLAAVSERFDSRLAAVAADLRLEMAALRSEIQQEMQNMTGLCMILQQAVRAQWFAVILIMQIQMVHQSVWLLAEQEPVEPVDLLVHQGSLVHLRM